MKIGICCDIETAVSISDIGYDFYELTVDELLVPHDNEAVFHSKLGLLERSEIKCFVLNRLLPKNLKIIGPDRNLNDIDSYLKTVFRRSREVGISCLVFGSGKSRSSPKGYLIQQAMKELEDFCRLATGYAEYYRTTLVLEPLCSETSNTLNTLAECREMISKINSPALKVLADLYHMQKVGDVYEEVELCGKDLFHVHICTASRFLPGYEDFDYLPFLNTLKKMDYSGSISIEANLYGGEDFSLPFKTLVPLLKIEDE